MRTYAPVLAICALTLGPALVANAANPPVVYKPCDKKPSSDDTEAAKGLFLAGKVSYNEADYSKAIQLWRDALERDCTANLLLQNLANAYEKAGETEAAIVTLETFLAREPQSPEAPTIQKRIENMKKAAAAATTTAPTASATAAPKPTAPASAPPPSTTAPPPAGGRPITPLIVAGAGGAFTLVGILVYAGGKSKIDESEAVCPDRKCPTSVIGEAAAQDAINKGNDGRKQATTGGILAGVGVAGIAGGLAWYFLSKPEEQSARIVAPALAPGYAGFSMMGRF